MSEIILPSTYNEPTIMWRMRHANDSSAHALIDTVEGRPRVVWFVNGRPVGARYFDDWTVAISGAISCGRNTGRLVGDRCRMTLPKALLLDATDHRLYSYVTV
jgi:hypothetical protein